MMKALVMPMLLCGLIAAVPQRATAATDPLFKCASSKVKAASKKEQGKFNCLSRAVRACPVHLHAGGGALVDELHLHGPAGGERHRWHGASGGAPALRADAGRTLSGPGGNA